MTFTPSAVPRRSFSRCGRARRAARPSGVAAHSSAAAAYARAFLAGALAMTLLIAAAVGGYAVKSRLGINLLPGPSPLHGIFVAMRGAGLV